MDVYCQQCGEPWEFLAVTDDFKHKERTDFWAGKGCPACDWGETAPKITPFRSDLMSVACDILGDDIDGIASEMEDAEMLFGDLFWEEGED